MSLRDEIKVHWRFGGALKRLLLINVGVFLGVHAIGLIAWLFGVRDLEDLIFHYLMASDVPSELIQRPWTVITYMFTHESVMHIFWNMLMFWFSGQMFQSVLGEQRLVGNYILGGLAGFVFYFIAGHSPAHLGLASGAPILGASAAVMAVFVGIAAYQPDLEVTIWFAIQVRLKWVALAVVFLDMLAIRSGDNTGGHAAHLGGALYGYLAAVQLKRGQDWSGGFARAMQRLFTFFSFKPRTRMRVEHGGGKRARALQDLEWNAAKKEKQQRVDAILDKISRSGYDSLNKEERDFLFKASNDK